MTPWVTFFRVWCPALGVWLLTQKNGDGNTRTIVEGRIWSDLPDDEF